MKIKELLIKNDEMKEEILFLKTRVKWQRKMIDGLKMGNARLTMERNQLIKENLSLKREITQIKKMGMFEFASKYCSDDELEEAGHAFARSLGVGE